MTLVEIIESVKSGAEPDYQDLRYAVLALDAMHTYSLLDFMQMSEAEHDGVNPMINDRAQETYKRCMSWGKAQPKDLIGWANDPDNPEYQAQRKLSAALVKGRMH